MLRVNFGDADAERIFRLTLRNFPQGKTKIRWAIRFP